jgi:hypothetical protein
MIKVLLKSSGRPDAALSARAATGKGFSRRTNPVDSRGLRLVIIDLESLPTFLPATSPPSMVFRVQ